MSNIDRHDEIQGKIVHEYDGILEADNELPRWWLTIFYSSIIFAVGYWFAYETWDVLPYPIVEYREAVAAAAASGGVEVTDELLATLAADPSNVSAGAEAFQANCAVCHGAQGQGDIGPNLTDGYWIHGGAPVEIHHTISEGVGTAGMPAWKAALGAQTVQRLSVFVMSLRDTNVPGKAPQGDLWSPNAGGGDDVTPEAESQEAESEEPAAADGAGAAGESAAGAAGESAAGAAGESAEGETASSDGSPSLVEGADSLARNGSAAAPPSGN